LRSRFWSTLLTLAVAAVVAACAQVASAGRREYAQAVLVGAVRCAQVGSTGAAR